MGGLSDVTDLTCVPRKMNYGIKGGSIEIGNESLQCIDKLSFLWNMIGYGVKQELAPYQVGVGGKRSLY